MSGIKSAWNAFEKHKVKILAGAFPAAYLFHKYVTRGDSYKREEKPTARGVAIGVSDYVLNPLPVGDPTAALFSEHANGHRTIGALLGASGIYGAKSYKDKVDRYKRSLIEGVASGTIAGALASTVHVYKPSGKFYRLKFATPSKGKLLSFAALGALHGLLDGSVFYDLGYLSQKN